MREIEKVLRRYDASLEWLLERIARRDNDIEALRQNGQMEEREKEKLLRTKRSKSIAEVLEEVEVLINTHFFNQFSQTKSSAFLKNVISHQGSIEMRLLKKSWRTLNCTPKTMKIIREIQNNLLCVGKRREMILKERTETMC